MRALRPTQQTVRRIIWLVVVLWLARSVLAPIPVTPDGQVDYLILKAGWDGSDPTVPTIEFARRYELPGIYTTLPVTRTPAFFIVNSFQLLDLTAGLWAIRVLNVFGAFFLGWTAARMWQVRWWTVSIPAMLLAWGTLTWTTAELVWAAMIAWTWQMVDRGDRWLFGVPLGLAVAVRAWPAILVVALLVMGRNKTAVGAASTAGILTIAGLAVPGVTFERALRSLTDDGWALAHGSNLSASTLMSRIGVPSALTIGVVTVIVFWAIRHMEVRRGYGIALMAGLLVSPIAWLHYWVATAPMWPSLLGCPARPVAEPQPPAHTVR